MKKALTVALLLVTLALVAWFGYQFRPEKRHGSTVTEPVRFGAEGYAPTSMQDCLRKNKIPFELGPDGSLYINDGDINFAIISCS